MKTRRLLTVASAFMLLIAGCDDDPRRSVPETRDQEAAMPGGGSDPETRDEEAAMPADDMAEISIAGDMLIYKGDINPESYKKLMDTARGKENALRTFVINSPGGDIDWGMRMGEWVFDNKLDVVVDTLCFSSCANYVFTAGSNKIIEDGGIVGWHGSAQQDALIAARTGKSLDATLREQAKMILKDAGEGNPTDSQIREEVEMLKKENAEDVAMEKMFLAKIGVPVTALIYGFTESQFETYRRSNSEGWTLSIAGMAKLGIEKVTYQGQGAYPDPAKLRELNVVLLDVE